MPRNNAGFWVLGTPVLCALIAAQIWSAYTVRQDLDDLRAYLASSVDAAMQLNQRIGYGGMIHNFKNYVLRSDQQEYADDVRRDANSALALIDELESSAHALNVNRRLTETRRMIINYRDRIDTVTELAKAGEAPRDIDTVVKVTDDPAIQEISLLMNQITDAITTRSRALEQRGSKLNWLSAAAAVLFAVTLLVLIFQRESRLKDQRHLASINALNLELASGNQELQVANKAIKQFAGMVSHDLKTPLQHISLFTSLVDKEADDPGSVSRIAGRIDETVQRMDRIINSLLEFTQTSFAQPKLETMSIRAAVARVVDELAGNISMREAQIINEVQGNVRADAELLNRVLHNLLGNSLKYVAPAVIPHIEIHSEQQGNMLVVSVSDNGIGIDPGEAESIFEPFHRLHNAVADYEGSGIGLSMAREIIQAHGGEIWVDNSFKEGARICFSLALARPSPERQVKLTAFARSILQR